MEVTDLTLVGGESVEVRGGRTWPTDPGVERVREFHAAFECVISPDPWLPTLSAGDKAVLSGVAARLLELAAYLKAQAAEANEAGRGALGLLLVRLQGHTEETGELAEAFAAGDLVAALDALVDSSYFVDGTFLTLGLGGAKAAAYDEVHRSNMSKLGEDGRPIFHPSGRVMKGPNYSPPDLAAVLEQFRG